MSLVGVERILANGYMSDLGKLLWIKNVDFAVLAQHVAIKFERIDRAESLGSVKREVALHDFELPQDWHGLNEQISILEELLMNPGCLYKRLFVLMPMLGFVFIHESHALFRICCLANFFQVLLG